jgi:hypothetical protein
VLSRRSTLRIGSLAGLPPGRRPCGARAAFVTKTVFAALLILTIGTTAAD